MGILADNNDLAGKPGNNTIANATNLPHLQKTGSVASIHSASDVDYYKFVLDSVGTSRNFFRINFTDADGDLDLILCDAKGNEISSSENRGQDSETVFFTGLTAGTYYVRAQGYSGALNNYTLDWDKTPYNPTPDNNDLAGKPGNNTIANATNLPHLQKTGSVASIHSASDVDYYKFVLDAAGTSKNFFRINFTDADGDLDLILCDAKGNEISSSENRGQDSETVLFTGLAAGTYYVRVQGYSGALNNYTLDWDKANHTPAADGNDAVGKPGNNTIANATNLPALIKDGAKATIHNTGDVDYYKFVMEGDGTANNFLNISFSDIDGDLDLYLYDSNGVELAASKNRGRDFEKVSMDGYKAGVYYFKVAGHDGALNSYTIDWDRSNYGPELDQYDKIGTNGNNTIETAANLGSSANGGIFMSIHSPGDVDFYKLSLASAGRNDNYAKIVFDGRYGELDFQILDAAGTLLQTASGDVKMFSLAGLEAGTYYLRVSGAKANSYSLSWDSASHAPLADGNDAAGKPGNDVIANATNLPALLKNGAKATIHTASDVDYYKFVMDGKGTDKNFFRINFINSDGDLDLVLCDAKGNELSSSKSRGSDSETVQFTGLAAGTYYVRVEGSAGALNSYTLDWDRTNYGIVADGNDAAGKPGNNTIANATNLPVLKKNGASATIHSAKDVDYYKFVLGGTGTDNNFFRINFTDSAGDLDLVLCDARGNELSSSKNPGQDSETVFFTGLAAGAYYVRVQGNSGALNSYTLDWDRSVYSPVEDSNDEPGKPGNNTISTATNLAAAIGSGINASIHSATDLDYYKFTLPGNGSSRNYAAIKFDQNVGNLDLNLYDEQGSPADCAKAETDGQVKINMAGLDAGTWYVAVSGLNGSLNNYALSWDRTKYVAEDKNDAAGSAGNDTIATASKVRADTNSGASATIHSSADVDYYAIQLTKKGATHNFFQINFTNSNGNLDLALYDANGNEVRSSRSTTANSERVNLTGLAKGTYYVKVSGANGDVNSYTMSWDKSPHAITVASDRFESNNSIAGAAWLPFEAGYYKGATSLGQAGDVDYFKFHIAMRGSNDNYFSISDINATGNLELSLVNAQGKTLRKAVSLSRTSQKLDLAALNPGTYYIKISSPDKGAGNYNIDWNCRGTPQTLAMKSHPGRWQADRFETENEQPLTLLGYSGSLTGVNIHEQADKDYYRITLAETGTSANFAQITYGQAWGKLALTLYDASGNAIKTSDTRSGTEKVSLNGLAAGTYYAAVETAGNTTSNSYTLKWNRRPESPGIRNYSFDGLTGKKEGLALTEAAATNIWSFTLHAEGTADNHILLGCESGLTARIKDSAGNTLFTGIGLDKINLGGLKAGSYTLNLTAAEPLAAENLAYSIDYDLGIHVRGAKVRGPEQSSLFSMGGSEYASIFGYGNVNRSDFTAGTYNGERLRSRDDAIYYDAEKCRSDLKDDNQCWAATASNMLAYSGWGERGIASAKGENAEDIIFDRFNAAFANAGGPVDDGMRWFFGPEYRSYSNTPTASVPGNYLGIEGSPYITTNKINSLGSMDQIASALQSGLAVGLAILGNINHAINVWGYTFDSSKSQGTAGYYTGLFITDSNDGSSTANAVNAPDCLQLIPISWDAANGSYYTSYYGSNRLNSFYTLDQAPRSKGAAMTASAFSAIEDIQEESALDSLLAQAMEPTAAVFQAGADSVHVGREKEINGILTA